MSKWEQDDKIQARLHKKKKKKKDSSSADDDDTGHSCWAIFFVTQ